jgi:hypothetical protein
LGAEEDRPGIATPGSWEQLTSDERCLIETVVMRALAEVLRAEKRRWSPAHPSDAKWESDADRPSWIDLSMLAPKGLLVEKAALVREDGFDVALPRYASDYFGAAL